MKFYTASSTPRPVRLSDAIRRWADEALRGKYGDEAMASYAVTLDDVAGFENFTPQEKYDAAIRRIAERAPVRICDEELICGSATLGLATKHCVPALFKGEPVFPSVSHLTIDYETTLKFGLNAVERQIEERLQSATDEQKIHLDGMKNVIDCMRVLHGRYLTELRRGRRGEVDRSAAEVLERVPFYPARTFREAVQSVWFVFSFVRLCGNWPGIGRLDYLLGDYLKQDLKDKRLDKNAARDILASFFVKGAEWVLSDTPRGTGDAQHYQNIVLGGTGENGKEITNEVTYLVLEILEELPISDFPVALRLNSDTPQRLLRKAAQVIRHGGGVVAVYDERSVIDGMVSSGYSVEEARKFANDGCWEVQVPGATCFGYIPFDGLQIFNRAAGIDGGEIPNFKNTDEIFAAFKRELKKETENIYRDSVEACYGEDAAVSVNAVPTSVIDLFEDGCIENAAPYYGSGPRYTVRSPHIGGAPDVANSIIAIEKIVFGDKTLSYREMINLLKNNWDGGEVLRSYAKNKITYYGNDDDFADGIMRRVVDAFCECVEEIAAEHPDCPVKFVPGISTFGRQIEWARFRSATAFGAKKGDVLSGNTSPTPGTDFSGATAIIRSYCKSNPARATCGAALDLKIFPESLKGRNGLDALISLLRAVTELKGSFVQIDTVDAATLYDAQKHPENYKTLSVRVSGWNARFVTLNEEWQNMIIKRTGQGL